MAVDRKDYERWAEEVKRSGSGEEFIERIMESDFSLNFEIYSPEMLRGAGSVKVGEKMEEVRERVVEEVGNWILSVQPINIPIPIIGGEHLVRNEVIKSISNLISQSLDSIKKIEPGKVSVSIRNNGNNAPSLVISIPGQKDKPIQLSETQSALIRTLLEGSLRAPDYNRIQQIRSNARETVKPLITSLGIPYGNVPHIKALWNQNIGQRTRVGGLGSVGYVLGAKNQILIPKKKDCYLPPYLRY